MFKKLQSVGIDKYFLQKLDSNLEPSLCFGLSNIPFIVFRIHQFGEDLSGMAARIEMICVCKSLAFASLFSTVTGKDMLVVIVVEVFVFVNVVLRHSSWFPNALEK